jgi:hypothetical protein
MAYKRVFLIANFAIEFALKRLLHSPHFRDAAVASVYLPFLRQALEYAAIRGKTSAGRLHLVIVDSLFPYFGRCGFFQPKSKG